MKFIKSNKLFFISLVTSLTLFAALQFVSCSSSSNIDIIVSEIEKKERLINELTNEISIFNGLSEDFKKANDNLIELAEVEKSQQRFWSNIVVNTENIYSNWSRKSSAGINADITRLFTTLRNLCSSNNISLESDSQNNINSFTPVPKEKSKKYGFGLSSYDGFWPSFSQEESMLLGIQSKIISSIVQFLSQSSNSEQRITLVHILRESVGDEDKQHIGMDLLKLPDLNTQLIRFNGGIRSFAFEIKFNGHTSHARSFINQLRPPFILRDLIINRVSTPTFNQNSNSLDPFSTENTKPTQPLPVVQNVVSTFTLLIEYVYDLDRDLEKFLKSSLNKDEIDNDILTKFLNSSGNSKLSKNFNL